MQPFRTIHSKLIPLPRNNVDTDQILPARFLKMSARSSLADALFADWRFRPDGSPDPYFPLNDPRYQGGQILLAGNNFGCGSSREHAPWALVDWGIRAVISTSFADIFRNNSLKNGLLPVLVDPQIYTELVDLCTRNPDALVSIDLQAPSLQIPGGKCIVFPIDPFYKNCLMNGVDELGYLLQFRDLVQSHESRRGLARRA